MQTYINFIYVFFLNIDICIRETRVFAQSNLQRFWYVIPFEAHTDAVSSPHAQVLDFELFAGDGVVTRVGTVL